MTIFQTSPLLKSACSPTIRPSARPSVGTVGRTGEKAFWLPDRVELSNAEARVEEIKGDSVGVREAAQVGARSHTHTEPKSAFMRLMASHG